MRRPWLLVAVAVICSSMAAAQPSQTLADVLQQESIPFPPSSIPDLNADVASFATLNDANEFVIAYYRADPNGERLLPPLLITRFNKRDGRWQHLPMLNPKVNVLDVTADCLGSVMSVQKSGGRYYMSLHMTPSAGCILVLRDDLTVDQTLAGMIESFFQSGLMLYMGDMVHFADVHPETLWLYDPAKRTTTQMYPQPHDPLREPFSARLKNVVNRQQCQANNWGCDPSRFGSDIEFPLQVNDQTKAFAFRVRFTTEGFLTREQAEDSGQWDDDEYVYVYQLSPFRWREFSIYDLKPKFGTDSLPDLLAPGLIDKVFATPAPN